MKVCGIIAEYNPFHKGHRYQLEKLQKTYRPDYIIIAMSGDFMQRGTPALLNKYARAEMSLLQGADLILELPAYFATASAESFARGGVMLLASTGLVDGLCFGAESGDLPRLKKLASLLALEPGWYRQTLKEHLKKGLSFPAARAKALPEYGDLLSLPNNILALEYLKAIENTSSSMEPVLIQRAGSGYHDRDVTAPLASASAIRDSIWQQDFPDSRLRDALPDGSFRILDTYSKEAAFLKEDDFSLLLHQALLLASPEGLLSCGDMTEALANRILEKREQFLSWSQFCEVCHTRDMTYSRISRTLTHLLLGISREAFAMQPSFLPYLRVLGFRKSAQPLLTELKKRAKAPLITSPAMANNLLTHQGMSMLQTDIHASDLYRSVLTAKTGKVFPTEYRRRLLVTD